MASSERFGFEWDKYSAIDQNYEKQFLNWTHPLDSKFFKDKKVLDAGCGMGRNSFWSLSWGASRVVSFDFDQRSVEAAKKNLDQFDNSEILFKSVYELDWHEEFDLAFSIGVIHHLKDPKLAIKNLFRAVKPGGRLLIWVYSYHGNEWIVKFVNPIRKAITSKLPVRLVHWLSYFCSVPLWLFVKIFKGPSDYLKQLSTFKFWHIHSIVFDQLIPEVAHYWTKEEVASLFAGLDVSKLDIHQPPNHCGWIAIARK
jgi:SAM-dependent methyltransferase